MTKEQETTTIASPVLSTDDDSLKGLIEKNIRWSQANYELSKKINRKLLILVWGSYLKWLLILVPLILGAIYLPPLLNSLFSQYQGLLGGTGTMNGLNILGNLNNQGDLNSLLKQIPADKLQELMKVINK